MELHPYPLAALIGEGARMGLHHHTLEDLPNLAAEIADVMNERGRPGLIFFDSRTKTLRLTTEAYSPVPADIFAGAYVPPVSHETIVADVTAILDSLEAPSAKQAVESLDSHEDSGPVATVPALGCAPEYLLQRYQQLQHRASYLSGKIRPLMAEQSRIQLELELISRRYKRC